MFVASGHDKDMYCPSMKNMSELFLIVRKWINEARKMPQTFEQTVGSQLLISLMQSAFVVAEREINLTATSTALLLTHQHC